MIIPEDTYGNLHEAVSYFLEGGTKTICLCSLGADGVELEEEFSSVIEGFKLVAEEDGLDHQFPILSRLHIHTIIGPFCWVFLKEE